MALSLVTLEDLSPKTLIKKNNLNIQSYHDIMEPIYQRGDFLMSVLIGFHFFIGIVLSFFYDTYLVGVLGGALATGIFFLTKMAFPGQFITRCMAGISLNIFLAIHIYQMHGMDEMHFWFFSAQTIMIVYQDWRCLWPGTILVVVHHTLFAYLTNLGFDLKFTEGNLSVTRFFWHYVVVIFQVVICNYWAVLLQKQTILEALSNIILAQKTNELEKANQALISSEEEIRQNAEELQATNESLITTQKELQKSMEELKESQNAVIQSEKMALLGSLVAGVAHEINTPLGIAVTAASHLETTTVRFVEEIKSPTINKAQIMGQYLKTADSSSKVILRNLERAAELIQSFKKVAVNQSAEEIIEFDLKKLVLDVFNSMSPTLRKEHVAHGIKIADDIVLLTYSGALSQVLINFITNAVRYAFDSESIDPKIIVSATITMDNQIILTFEDNGKGIPAENISKIFDPFFTTGRNIGGSGLGLNIVYNIVTQKLMGTIDVKSKPNEGTTFTLSFPRYITTQ